MKTTEEELADIVEFVLEIHEWCETPSYVNTKCGETHISECYKREDGFLCDGCRMKKIANRVMMHYKKGR